MGRSPVKDVNSPRYFWAPPALHCSPGGPHAAVSEWLQEKASFGNAASSRCSAWNLLLSFIIIFVDEFLFLSGEMNQIPIIFSAVHDFARLIVKVPDSKLLNPNLRRVAPPGPKSWGFRRPWAPRAGRRRWSTGSLRTTHACRIPQGAFAGKGWRGWGFFWADIAESILKVDVCWFDLICYDFLILWRQISEQIQRNTKDRSVAVEGLGDAVVKEGHNWQVLVLVWGCLYFPESCYCTFTKLGAPWTNSGTVEIPRRYKFWKMLARTSHPIVAHSWLFYSRVQTLKVESSKDVQRSGFVGCGKLWKTTILLPDIINIY